MQETNFIGTAWLRLNLLPASDQPAMRELFRRYLDARLDVYRSLPDLVASEAALARTAQLQSQIWQQAVSATARERSPPFEYPRFGFIRVDAADEMLMNLRSTMQ